MRVEEVVLDFEQAMWAAIRNVLGVPVKGCAFHWVQAVYRNVQERGLSVSYRNDEGTHSFCRRLMALPFLPAEFIPRAFCVLLEEDLCRSKPPVPVPLC